jgi:lysophospholipase L1-like esterase
MTNPSPPPEVFLPNVATALAAGRLVVSAFGSSTTEGVGASSPANTYPARLEAELADALPRVKVTVINRGQGGEEAEDFDRRLPDVIVDRPNLVIFQTGTNDAIRSVPLPDFEQLTRHGIETFHKAGIDVVLMEPQYSRAVEQAPDFMAYIELVRKLGAEYGLPVIRRYELMKSWLASGRLTPAELITEDDLHMADGGYRELAKAVMDTILDNSRA